MKHLIFSLILSAIALMSSSCDKFVPTGKVDIPARVDIALTKAQSEVLAAGEEFNFDFFRNVFDGTDVFVSPLSLQAAFSMALNGAEGVTYDEIAKAIGYEGKTIEEVNSLYNALIEGLAKVDTSTKFEIANSIWVKKGFELYPQFISALEKEYKAGCEELDFSQEEAVAKINKWCSDNTHGLIPDMFDQIDPRIEMMLINALYFKGVWANEFNPDQTHKEPFTSIDGKTVSVDMMSITREFKYSENDRAQFVALPFGNEAFELDVVLPRSDVNFSTYISKFDADEWNSLASKACRREVVLRIPKFKMDNKIKLNSVLADMGIVQAFTDDATFSKISKIALKISEVVQRAVFSMDEKGAEAAAITEIGFEKCTSAGPSMKTVFIADHPFIFAIRETTSSAILFIGAHTGSPAKR